MNIEKHPISGAWCCSTISNGQVIRQTYYGYTKAQARAEFAAYVKSLA